MSVEYIIGGSIGRWQSTHWEWCRDRVISQDLVVYLILDINPKGVQYILEFKVLRDYKNRKIVLCQAYTQVSLENEGLCACVPKHWDSIEGQHDGWQDTFCG